MRHSTNSVWWSSSSSSSSSRLHAGFHTVQSAGSTARRCRAAALAVASSGSIAPGLIGRSEPFQLNRKASAQDKYRSSRLILERGVPILENSF
mmetsp:Transcript_11098/g.25447  ORF Transcript_11098/g.25447 Transcript_11098/m.25447 type:complete len:93 (-) Transcript_11098:1623-1901(-)